MIGTDTNIVEDMNASINCARQNNKRISGLLDIVTSWPESCSYGNSNAETSIHWSGYEILTIQARSEGKSAHQ